MAQIEKCIRLPRYVQWRRLKITYKVRRKKKPKRIFPQTRPKKEFDLPTEAGIPKQGYANKNNSYNRGSETPIIGSKSNNFISETGGNFQTFNFVRTCNPNSNSFLKSLPIFILEGVSYSKSKFYTIEYYSHYFDVDTNEVFNS